MTLRVVVCGQRSFGAAVVCMTAAHPAVELVLVAAPPAGTDRRPDRTWRAAADVSAPTVAADDFRADTVPSGTDLIVAAHSHNFVGRRSLLAARLGGVGYHPSLLPRHRGRDAVRWTVHMGDPVTGGTVYWLTDNVDGGPVAAQDWCWVRPGTDHHDLWRRRLFPLGVDLLRRVFDDLAAGVVVQVPQDETVATWEPSWGREPLHRPELAEIGAGPAGYRVVTRQEYTR